mgnify:FL=1
MFVGDLDPALSDTLFHDAFAKWPSFVKAKIVRDKTNKGKGYGFASYSDPEDMLKAWKAMNGQSSPPFGAYAPTPRPLTLDRKSVV